MTYRILGTQTRICLQNPEVADPSVFFYTPPPAGANLIRATQRNPQKNFFCKIKNLQKTFFVKIKNLKNFFCKNNSKTLNFTPRN